MSFRVDISSGLLRQQIRNLSRLSRDSVRRAMRLAVGLVHRHATIIVHVDTGRLKNSLFWNDDYEPNSNDVVGVVGTSGVEYARIIEDRYPYLGPALTENTESINSIFAQSLNQLYG